MGKDVWDGVHLSDSSGAFARYDIDGNLVWSTNLSSPCNAMVLDSSGNRFVSLFNGTVARIGAETVSLPTITTNPISQTVFVGTNVVLSAGVSGFSPLRYAWFFENNFLTNTLNSTLTLNNVSPAQSGHYVLVVTNFLGAVTSTPALLRVKSVQLYNGSQMLTNGTYEFISPPTLTVRSAFTNGSRFYTLDGSAPSFASTFYSGPFTVTQNATVRAIGYSADFSQSDEADIVNVVFLGTHTLTATSSDGGNVTLNPPGGTYTNANIITATATPDANWSFLYWLGDSSGTNPSVNIFMNHDKRIHAVFGTTLSTTVTGNGSVQLSPPGGLYPFGTTVRLTGIPQSGNYFGFWGNAVTGNTNPLYFTISSPAQTVSSIFGTLPSGQAALTVLINGHGRVNVNPRTNAYATNQLVTLTATPDAGQSFLNWSDDASGTQNPLTVSLTQSKTITANFSNRSLLRTDRTGLEGWLPDGFRFTLVGDPLSACEIFASTNLNSWTSLGILTNAFGEIQFTDTNASSFRFRFYKSAP